MSTVENENKTLLCNKRLTVFPDIAKETRILDIKRNRLKSIHFPQDSQLVYLDVSDNLIDTMKPVSELKYLEVLDFGYNLLKEIPPLDLPSLRELYLMSNDIEEIKNLDFPNLEKLDVANNDIKVLENINCTNITEAYFGANKISSLVDLTQLTNLKILDLQYNKLYEVDCIHLPQSIEILLLNNNKSLYKICNIDHLVNLKMLGVKNTKIGDVNTGGRFELW